MEDALQNVAVTRERAEIAQAILEATKTKSFFTIKEIQQMLGVSYLAVVLRLKRLERLGLVKKLTRGIYTADRQMLQKLIEKYRRYEQEKQTKSSSNRISASSQQIQTPKQSSL